MNTPIILASTSPRRQQLLRQIGVRFEVQTSDVSENFREGLPPTEVVRTLANRKCSAISALRPEALVIAADTVVSINNVILGKPHTAPKAVAMLKNLSNRTHQVITGVAFQCLNKNIKVAVEVSTDVTFGDLSEEVIDNYIATGEPLDKAGSYGIQGFGAVLVKSINGSYYNVVGLPLHEVATVLQQYVGSDCYLRI